MNDLTITIVGVDRLVAKFGRVASLNYLKEPMYRAVYRIQGYMANYPRQRNPNTRYIRGRGWADKDGVVRRLTSEHLGKRWTTKVDITSDGLRGKVGNNVSYAPYVQSAKFQATVHKGWWQTDEMAVRRNRAAIVRDFNSAIRRALQA
jgi:hypothetical protein